MSIHRGKYAPTFFSQFVPVETDLEKAVKVAKSIRVKISLGGIYDGFQSMHAL